MSGYKPPLILGEHEASSPGFFILGQCPEQSPAFGVIDPDRYEPHMDFTRARVKGLQSARLNQRLWTQRSGLLWHRFIALFEPPDKGGVCLVWLENEALPFAGNIRERPPVVKCRRPRESGSENPYTTGS